MILLTFNKNPPIHSQQIRIWWQCQSANQLKTPAKVPESSNGLSVWFTRRHNHGEDCWSEVVRRQSLTPFTRSVRHNIHYQRSCSQSAVSKHVTESWVEEKDAQPTERTAALWGLSSKIDSRIWVNFTRNGLRLGSRHREHHTQTCRGIIQLSSEASYLG